MTENDIKNLSQMSNEFREEFLLIEILKCKGYLVEVDKKRGSKIIITKDFNNIDCDKYFKNKLN